MVYLVALELSNALQYFVEVDDHGGRSRSGAAQCYPCLASGLPERLRDNVVFAVFFYPVAFQLFLQRRHIIMYYLKMDMPNIAEEQCKYKRCISNFTD